jgi:hypothetical protein
MTVRDSARRLLMAAAAILICATALHAQTAPASLWAKVPPLPTACYSQDDAAYNQLTAMHDSVQADPSTATSRSRQPAAKPSALLLEDVPAHPRCTQ